MADYITPTSTSSLHSSPSRKRTRESHTTRSSTSYLSSCKTAATVTSNVEVMESLCETDVANSLPTITQPRSSIHSIQNGLSSIESKSSNNIVSNGITNSANGVLIQPPITVSIYYIFFPILTVKNIKRFEKKKKSHVKSNSVRKKTLIIDN